MRRLLVALLVVSVLAGGVAACAKPAQEKAGVSVGAVKVNAHPTSLEGKTVVLRWNGKPNGDKLLTRIGELLTEQVKGIKIVKLWETEPSTAAISKDAAASEEVATKIAALKPDLVIASQCD